MDYKEKVCLNNHANSDKPSKRSKHAEGTVKLELTDMKHKKLKRPGSLSAS